MIIEALENLGLQIQLLIIWFSELHYTIFFITVVKVSYFLVKMNLLKQAFQLISAFPLLKLIAKFVFHIQLLSPI